MNLLCKIFDHKFRTVRWKTIKLPYKYKYQEIMIYKSCQRCNIINPNYKKPTDLPTY